MPDKYYKRPDEITGYYKDKTVAAEYTQKRFSEPIFRVEHKRQVEILNSIIKRYHCKKILEIAPGPARLTRDIDAADGTAMDSSEEMLKLAKKAMGKRLKNWNFVKGDAFNLKFKEHSFDMVFTFRFLFHFKAPKRKEFYGQVRRVLLDKGIFAFEALNLKKVKPVRKFVGEKKYNIFSEMFDRDKLCAELRENGFQVIKMFPHISHFWTEMLVSRVFSMIKLGRLAEMLITLMEKINSRNPYEWVVLCQKR